MVNSGCWRFADSNRLPRETDQEGVTNPENSAEDLSWMTRLSTDKLLQSVERLAQEIRDEGVTDDEKVSFIEHFEELMGRTNDIVTFVLAVGEEKSIERVVRSSFRLVPLSSEEVQMLKMTEAETDQLRTKLQVTVGVSEQPRPIITHLSLMFS